MTASIDAATAQPVVGWRRAAPLKLDAITIVASLVLLLLALLVIPPVLILIYGSFTVPPPGMEYTGFSLANFVQVLEGHKLLAGFQTHSLWPRLRRRLRSSSVDRWLGWSSGPTCPLKNLAYLTCVVSLGTPFVVYAVSWLFLLGQSWPAQRPLSDAHGIDGCPVQHPLAERHDPGPGLHLVPGGFSVACAGVSERERRHGRSRADVRGDGTSRRSRKSP